MEDERTVAMAGAIDRGSSSYWQDPKVYYETQQRILTGIELARRVVRRLDLGRVPEFAGDGSTPAAAPLLTGSFLARVSVVPVQNSRLVDVSFVSADADFAALAVNTLAEEYVEQNLELRRQNMVASLEWLSQELVKQQKTLEASERAMAQYREDQNALSLEERQNIVVARLNHLNDAVTRAKTNRVAKEALADQVEALGRDVSAETIPAVLQNPFIQAIKTRLADLQREKATLLERYGDKYPDVMKVNASLHDASLQLQAEVAKAIGAIRLEYQSALAEEQTLAAALEAQKGEAMELNRKGVRYTVLEREADSNRQVYEALLLREKELQVMANSRGNNVRLSDRAETPRQPFTPTPRRDLLLAIVAGLALSLGLVFLLDYLDDTVQHPDDVTRKLKIPLLGLTPKVSGDARLLLSPAVSHAFGEAFRSVRTALTFSSGSESTRLVMVTSAQPLEGKTTVACNLSLALAAGGARVLLIDADMRRSGVHRLLAIENGTGLSHVLTGQASLDAAVVTLEHGGVAVLTAGTSPPNPSELLGSGSMNALLAEAKNGRYDWVILDSPPVLAVTDAVVLAPLVSAIAFVIGSGMTRRPHVAGALDMLSAGSTGPLGVVLNRVDFERNKYYYARRYGYGNASCYYDSAPAA
jgi:capsular exopolysaccharide synthesis family protein